MIKTLKMIGDKVLCFSGHHVGVPVECFRPVATTIDGYYSAVSLLDKFKSASIVKRNGQPCVMWRRCSKCGREVS